MHFEMKDSAHMVQIKREPDDEEVSGGGKWSVKWLGR